MSTCISFQDGQRSSLTIGESNIMLFDKQCSIYWLPELPGMQQPRSLQEHVLSTGRQARCSIRGARVMMQAPNHHTKRHRLKALPPLSLSE